MADPLKANLCLDALAMALGRRANVKGLIHSEYRVLVMRKTQLILAIQNNIGPPMPPFSIRELLRTQHINSQKCRHCI
jgi:hypothetical protein